MSTSASAWVLDRARAAFSSICTVRSRASTSSNLKRRRSQKRSYDIVRASVQHTYKHTHAFTLWEHPSSPSPFHLAGKLQLHNPLDAIFEQIVRLNGGGGQRSPPPPHTPSISVYLIRSGIAGVPTPSRLVLVFIGRSLGLSRPRGHILRPLLQCLDVDLQALLWVVCSSTKSARRHVRKIGNIERNDVERRT